MHGNAVPFTMRFRKDHPRGRISSIWIRLPWREDRRLGANGAGRARSPHHGGRTRTSRARPSPPRGRDRLPSPGAELTPGRRWSRSWRGGLRLADRAREEGSPPTVDENATRWGGAGQIETDTCGSTPRGGRDGRVGGPRRTRSGDLREGRRRVPSAACAAANDWLLDEHTNHLERSRWRGSSGSSRSSGHGLAGTTIATSWPRAADPRARSWRGLQEGNPRLARAKRTGLRWREGDQHRQRTLGAAGVVRMAPARGGQGKAASRATRTVASRRRTSETWGEITILPGPPTRRLVIEA